MTDRPDTGAAAGPTAGSTAGSTADAVLDCLGRRCPIPVIELARRMTRVEIGQVVELWADDPAAEADVAAWCRMRGQELVEAADRPGGGRSYRVRRVR